MTNDATLEIGTKYEVLAGQPFVRATMTVRNVSSSPIANVNAWAGTRDDRIGGDDSPRKIRGNITSTGFAVLTDATDTSNAVIISNAGDSNPDGTFNVVLFSPAAGSRSVFSNLGSQSVGSGEGYDDATGDDTGGELVSSIPSFVFENPSSAGTTEGSECLLAEFPHIQCTTDGSYGMYMPVGDLAPNEAKTIVYYYGVGFGTDLDVIMESLYDAANPPMPDTTQPTNPSTTLPREELPDTGFGDTALILAAGFLVMGIVLTTRSRRYGRRLPLRR